MIDGFPINMVKISIVPWVWIFIRLDEWDRHFWFRVNCHTTFWMGCHVIWFTVDSQHESQLLILWLFLQIQQQDKILFVRYLGFQPHTCKTEAVSSSLFKSCQSLRLSARTGPTPTTLLAEQCTEYLDLEFEWPYHDWSFKASNYLVQPSLA